MEPSSADVVLTYTLCSGLGLLLLAAAVRGAVASYLWSSMARGQGAGRVRRAGRWLQTGVAFLFTGVLASLVLVLVVGGTLEASGAPDDVEFSRGWAIASVVAVVALPIAMFVVTVASARWIRRQQRRLIDETQWASWVEGDWQIRMPRAVALAAWQARLVLTTGGVALALAVGPFVYDGIGAVVAGVRGREAAQSVLTTSVTGLLLTLGVVAVVVPCTMLWRPDWYLAEHALAALGPLAEETNGIAPGHPIAKTEVLRWVRGGPARWRSPFHRSAFAAAGALRRCIPRFRRRLTPQQYETVALAAVRVATSVREAAVTAHRGGAAKDQLTRSVQAALGLVFTDDLARTVDRVEEAFPARDHRESRVPSRTRLLLEGASESVLRFWPAIKVVLVVGLGVTLVVSGQLPKLVDLLKG